MLLFSKSNCSKCLNTLFGIHWHKKIKFLTFENLPVVDTIDWIVLVTVWGWLGVGETLFELSSEFAEENFHIKTNADILDLLLVSLKEIASKYLNWIILSSYQNVKIYSFLIRNLPKVLEEVWVVISTTWPKFGGGDKLFEVIWPSLPLGTTIFL